ncbi:hormogonium polysaccharide secretion pseudopilin HpsC [Scytonema sp. NUACC26]|uniref:hormogonium polysaccharide secretion pseudopilin HpsC n=1 Tax=Scytonema sp. NUACC26 TaxID=3140176 RepID=UPI0034DCB928
MSSLQWLFSNQIKYSKLFQKVSSSGFTLIELLVAIVLAALIITPLLGFMVNVLDADRREQAKTSSEQEIQNAFDYINRDLQQAVYIYDADGLTRNSNPTTPSSSGIKDQIPPASETSGTSTVGCSNSSLCQPILVFWKRKYLRDVIEFSGGTGTDTKDDTFVYSLVAYYIIKDNNTTWSKAARIARFEVSDGIQVSNGQTCTGYSDTTYLAKTGGGAWCPDKGFKRFNLSETVGELKDKMNTWTKASSNYSENALVLIDFIDQTAIGSSLPTCPSGSGMLVSGSFMGFYACINSNNRNSTAQIFIRGNALARVQNNDLDYSKSQKSYFPTASIRVQGRGYLFNK